RALEVVRALPDGSELAIVLAGKPARVLIPLGRDLANARRALAESELPAVRSNDLTAALELALRQQHRGLVTPQRILVLSDFARHVSFESKTLPDANAVSYERVGSTPSKTNLYVAATQASVDPARPSETSIAVDVRAAAPATAQIDARVEVELQGKVVHSQAITIERGAAQAVLRVPTPLPSQTLEARVRIVADDALLVDNQVSVVLGHADALQLLLVNGDPRPSSRADELYYASRALTLLSETQLAMRVQTVDPMSFEHARLDDSDVIVLANVAAPGPGIAEQIVEFVEAGGGLIIAAGSRIDAAQYNARLSALLPGHIRGSSNSNNLALTLPNHSDFLPEGLLGLREVRSQQRLLVDLLPESETLLQFEDGAPALAARSSGDGRTLLLASSLDTDFSDLPLRPGYLPLLTAMIRDAAGATAAARGRIAPGERVSLPNPKPDHIVEVRGPNGRRWQYAHREPDEPIQFDASDALGVFEIRTGRAGDSEEPRLRATFVVDPPRDESDLSPGPVPDQAATADADGHATPVEVHASFSPWLWLFVFALVLCEGYVRARKRWGERLSH
ncbi:MAG TPA: VWA domain-containing protein, partial [Polyangiales bacterium]|nr:VWA domain-containing protein [Polyangiales bacterium]